jgi:small multidrug resistance pump
MIEIRIAEAQKAVHVVPCSALGGVLMYWLYLALAIVLEVCGTTSMKLSDGFSKLTPSVLIFIFYGLSFAAFVFALKRIDVSLAYAIWAGLGVLLISAVGIVYFKEPVSALKIASTVLVIGGVIGLYSSNVGH